MTVSTSLARVQYATNGTTGPWTVSFRFLADEDLAVIYTDSSGNETTLVLNTDFAVTGAGNPAGGTVTTTTAYIAGGYITVLRDMEYTQDVDYTDTDSFPAETHEEALDRLTMLVQQVKEVTDRALVFSPSDTAGTELPAASDRASQMLGFDSLGRVSLSVPADGTAASLALDLANASIATKGAAMVGYHPALAYAANSVGHALNEVVYATEYGCVGDGTTVNDTNFQSAVNAAAGKVLYISKGSSYYRLTTRITVQANTRIVLAPGAELKWTTKPAAGTSILGATTYPGLECTGSGVTIEGKGGKLTGPSSAAYVANEICILMVGTSSASRKLGLTVRDVEISYWGAYGVIAQFVDEYEVSTAHIHDIGLAGVQSLSCSRHRIVRNTIGTITPGSGGTAYGISLSHDSTGYAGSQKSATHPFAWDSVIDGNTIYDVPLWYGIDLHGAYEAQVTRNRTYNCMGGISVASSSGAAANYAGWNNSVCGNIITVKKRDGSATSVGTSSRWGIVVSGGSTELHDGVVVDGNIIDGYGDATPAGASILANYTRNARICNNIIKNWYGRGIYTTNGGGTIDGNQFDAVASATNSTCIYLDSTTDSWNVTHNKHRPLSGTVAAEGMRMFAGGNPRGVIAGNDMESATTPYTNINGGVTTGQSDFTPKITASGTPTSISIAAAGKAPHVWVDLGVSGPSTVADITGGFIGQYITLYASTANATTFDRTNSALAGGANWVSTQYDTLTLLCVSGSGTKFVEVGRSANS